MYSVTKAEIIDGVLVENLLSRKESKLFEHLSEPRYRLFCKAFIHTIKERFPVVTSLPKTLTFALRHVVSDDKARYVRLFELSSKFVIVAGDDKKTQYDLTFEIYKNPDDEEDCELLSYYSAEYIPEK